MGSPRGLKAGASGTRFAYGGRGGGIGGVLHIRGAGGESGRVTAVAGQIVDQLAPGRWLHQGRDDAEVEADIKEDGGDLAVAVPLDDFREDFLLGRGLATEGGLPGRPARRDGRSGGVRLATARPPSAIDPLRGPIIAQGEAEKRVAGTGEAAAEPALERGEAEQTAGDDDSDQGGIGGAEDGREEGIPGQNFWVVVLAQCLDEVAAVGEERAEEAEDVADAGGVEARGHGPIGTGVDGRGCSGGGVGHAGH